MMREFLQQYENARDLDSKQYDCHFDQGVDRADFLLFENQIVCEIKEIQNIKVQYQVEKLARRGNISDQNFKRDFYNSINKALSKANRQIEQSRSALNHPNALRLVILENLIQDELSVLSLIDASNRKMLSGLDCVDGVFCVDFVNTFSNSEGKPERPAQLLLRNTEGSAKLNKLLQPLMKDLCEFVEVPFHNGLTIQSGEQFWETDQNGRYHSYRTKFDYSIRVPEDNPDWKEQLVNFLSKWWWIIPVPAVLYDWFIR